ncbi:TetR/AcrR family transcriptional regulator [Sphaerisporangium sp. TRM90804]|uniref:TetR/AcrR family transcriptional regulator n=1 Tax=Sphaerisporangium sp. TRM90804 TaxID=3031113 RepID=UPI0024497D3D|nr:TetR/AcrR family transcriptional regulator [Sphaerisporangium sp. TRM90804]MDH2428359.1 TetR/AcrR family transcriptional regulator [Sphaerisporangium sp. TRM90804]
MARRPAPDTRERIMAVASRLFREYGVRAVGMQQVVDETGLGKSLLYREFASKDDLVAAWLKESDIEWWKMVDTALRKHDGDPAAQLLRLVEMTYESAKSPNFHGCIFYNTSTEFRDSEHPGRRQALVHLQRMRERLGHLAETAKATDPDKLADALMLVIGGLYVNGAALGPEGPVVVSIPTARTLINRYCPTPVGDPH